MTRRAISPRLAIRTFLNIALTRGLPALAPAHLREGLVGRALDAAQPERELAGVGGEEERHLVADRALVIPLHQGLVEGLHPVLDGAFLDQVRNVERLLRVPNVVLHRG